MEQDVRLEVGKLVRSIVASSANLRRQLPHLELSDAECARAFMICRLSSSHWDSLGVDEFRHTETGLTLKIQNGNDAGIKFIHSFADIEFHALLKRSGVTPDKSMDLLLAVHDEIDKRFTFPQD